MKQYGVKIKCNLLLKINTSWYPLEVLRQTLFLSIITWRSELIRRSQENVQKDECSVHQAWNEKYKLLKNMEIVSLITQAVVKQPCWEHCFTADFFHGNISNSLFEIEWDKSALAAYITNITVIGRCWSVQRVLSTYLYLRRFYDLCLPTELHGQVGSSK